MTLLAMIVYGHAKSNLLIPCSLPVARPFVEFFKITRRVYKHLAIITAEEFTMANIATSNLRARRKTPREKVRVRYSMEYSYWSAHLFLYLPFGGR